MKTTDFPLKKSFAIAISLAVFIIIIFQTAFIFYLWQENKSKRAKNNDYFIITSTENNIQKQYPDVDFTKIYPDLTAPDIDRLQRETLSLRFAYVPFVETKYLPTSKQFITITNAGFRLGRYIQPWPPRKKDFVVFVFGGSTTFGFDLPDYKTVVTELQNELTAAMPDKSVQCYNFGTGYYFSTQEMILFQTLLQQGHVPNLAIFIDGLNDFYFSDGIPNFTRTIQYLTAPDLPRFRSNKIFNFAKTASTVINRYKNNVRMIEAIAKEFHTQVIFVAQPVPFFDFNKNKTTYPFISYPETVQILCKNNYGDFKKAGQENKFGEHFLWCGDAFANANSIMYADAVHYSYDGVKLLSNCIVQKAMQKHLLFNTSLTTDTSNPIDAPIVSQK